MSRSFIIQLSILFFLAKDASLTMSPQVLHNMALVEAQLGNWEKAQEHLTKALNYKTEARFNIIDKALQSILVSCDTITFVNPFKCDYIYDIKCSSFFIPLTYIW